MGTFDIISGKLQQQIEQSVVSKGANKLMGKSGGPLASVAGGLAKDLYNNPAAVLSMSGGDLFNRVQGAGLFKDSPLGALTDRIFAINNQAKLKESADRFRSEKSPLLGGVTAKMAQAISKEIALGRYAKKNLFRIHVMSAMGANMPTKFNFFATDVEYTPTTISGEKNKIGGVSADSARSKEPIEMRVTTFDSETGVIRKWFDWHASAVAASDGTVGVPSEFAVFIKVIHAFTQEEGSGVIDYNHFRASNAEVSLSRREDALQELQLTFVQLDNFMPVVGSV